MMTATVETPVGRLRIRTSERGVCEVRFRARKPIAMLQARGGRDDEDRDADRRALGYLRRACDQLGEYFAGTRTRFDVPVDLPAATAFERAVWRACERIPFGETRSYGELAAAAGRPRAARAVGNAMNANRVPILVPCHRVIRADGGLGGFGSGVALKRKLLALERR